MQHSNDYNSKYEQDRNWWLDNKGNVQSNNPAKEYDCLDDNRLNAISI